MTQDELKKVIKNTQSDNRPMSNYSRVLFLPRKSQLNIST